MGLRGILASTENLDDARLADKLRALRRDAPVKLEYQFWGAQFLAMAFGRECAMCTHHPTVTKPAALTRPVQGASHRECLTVIHHHA